MRHHSAAVALLGFSLLPAAAFAQQDVVEPKSGVRFAAHSDGMSLLGVGVRTRTFVKVKVYAIGLYVADDALKGRLAPFKGRTASPEFYRELVWADFPKQVTMKFVRDTTASQVRDAFYEALPGVDRSRLDVFVSHFGAPRNGDVYEVRWTPSGVLEVAAAGQPKQPIADKAFAAAVFGIWLGEKPIQQDIKRDLVSRAPQLIP